MGNPSLRLSEVLTTNILYRTECILTYKNALVSGLEIMPGPYTEFQQSFCIWPTISHAKHLRFVLPLYEFLPLSRIPASLIVLSHLLAAGPNGRRVSPFVGGVYCRHGA